MKFQPGDKVVDFRGRNATIKTTRGNKVTVQWDDTDHVDNREFYESVFEKRIES